MLKKHLINSLIIFALSFLFHSLFNYLPFFPITIISPVNESIFEHMKMIFTSYMFYSLIIYLFMPKYKNYYFALTIGSIFNIIIFLIIYLPIYILFKENFILTLIIYFITIFITSFFIEKFKKIKNNKRINFITTITIILVYIIFAILTYFPPHIKLLFQDPTNKSYGITYFK